MAPSCPRRWRGAILPHAAKVGFDTKDPNKRPISATADFHEVRDVRTVEIRQSRRHGVRLLFDPEHNLQQRILDEQFAL
jgi:NAD+ kinase